MRVSGRFVEGPVCRFRIHSPFVDLLLPSGQSSLGGVFEDGVHAFVHRHLSDTCSHQTGAQDGQRPEAQL